MKGDVSGIFEHVDVNVVRSCVGKAVKDQKVLGLINRAFRAPVNNGAQCSSGGKYEFLFFLFVEVIFLNGLGVFWACKKSFSTVEV